jgi:phosphoribosylformylglycinamidine synthase
MRTVGVVTFPGSNCDADFRYAVDLIPGLRSTVLWHKDHDLKHVDAVVLPGGFSYGDYLRCGAIARFSPIVREVVAFAGRGGPVLGVCNGFQILCEAGLLPGALLLNQGLKFLCEDTLITANGRSTPFTAHLSGVLRVPIAHGDGNWFADDATLERCIDRGQVVFRYVDERGEPVPGVAHNGSLYNVAGLCSEAGNVVGLMPHPERAVAPELGSTDGLGFLTSLAEYLG